MASIDVTTIRKLVYCDKPEFSEATSDEEEEGWIGGMFDFPNKVNCSDVELYKLNPGVSIEDIIDNLVEFLMEPNATTSELLAELDQIAFTTVDFPCLLLAYMGQAAYLIKHPYSASRIFYESVPGCFLAEDYSHFKKVDGAYVYFSTPVPKDLLTRIKNDTSVLPRIGALREFDSYMQNGAIVSIAFIIIFFFLAHIYTQYGVTNRGASISVGRDTEKDGKGYIEDRRPASNMYPYVVTSMIVETTIIGNQCHHHVGFFRWIDEEMCSRSKHLIPELIRDKNNLELTLITEQAKLKCVQAVMERQGKALGYQRSLDERLNTVLAAQRDLTLHLGLCEKKERKLKIIIAALVLVIAFQVMLQPAFGRSRG
ncbi:hypothetical protein CASFOL_022966 [Castilleja foliolosa]|uniref:K+ potassium transporter integral membrane domain-containing protein n=1 Tax=Castilleja foliolosa TaxID=1961234 RepID=A0ABD3CVN4_9LAMI